MSLVKPLRIQNKRFKYRDWTVLLPVTIFFTHRSLSRLKVKLRVHSFVCLFFPPFASAVCSLRYLLIWVASHLFIGFLMGCLGREGSSYFHYGYYWNWCELPRWLSGKESACQCRRGRLDSWIPGPGRSHRKRNSNPLQYSDLENPMGRGAWWATVHGVAKSQTRLGCWNWAGSYGPPRYSSLSVSPHFLFVRKRLQLLRPSMSPKGQAQTVTHQRNEGIQEQRKGLAMGQGVQSNLIDTSQEQRPTLPLATTQCGGW